MSLGRTTDVGTVRLRPGGVVRGIVVDAADQPIASATIQIGVGAPPRPEVRSDEAGRFEMRGLLPGRIGLVARHPSYAAAASGIVNVDSEDGAPQVRIVMKRGGRVEGVVRHRNGEPFSDARVVITPSPPLLTSENPVMPVETEAAVEADGSFAGGPIEPGPAFVVVSAPRPSPLRGLSRRSGFTEVVAREVRIEEGRTTLRRRAGRRQQERVAR